MRRGAGQVTGRSASRPTLLALSVGHGCADLASSALWALLPFLVVERHYSHAAVGVFALAASLASALLQPLVGAHGDRGEARWLLPAGLILAGLGIAAVLYAIAALPLVVAALAAQLPCPAAAPPGTVWRLGVEAER
jgi:FSR family fosmidomycin resistance protein-like MFS transporter